MIEAAAVCGHGILSKLCRVRERMNRYVVGSNATPIKVHISFPLNPITNWTDEDKYGRTNSI
jgi:hypothetical protein